MQALPLHSLSPRVRDLCVVLEPSLELICLLFSPPFFARELKGDTNRFKSRHPGPRSDGDTTQYLRDSKGQLHHANHASAVLSRQQDPGAQGLGRQSRIQETSTSQRRLNEQQRLVGETDVRYYVGSYVVLEKLGHMLLSCIKQISVDKNMPVRLWGTGAPAFQYGLHVFLPFTSVRETEEEDAVRQFDLNSPSISVVWVSGNNILGSAKLVVHAGAPPGVFSYRAVNTRTGALMAEGAGLSAHALAGLAECHGPALHLSLCARLCRAGSLKL